MAYNPLSTLISYAPPTYTPLPVSPYSLSPPYLSSGQTSPGEIRSVKSRGSLRSVRSEDFPYDRALSTRNWCVVGLVSCWLLGGAVVAFGVWGVYVVEKEILDGDDSHGDYAKLPHMAAESIPLVINLLVTLIDESTGYIHTASLRWTLQRENRLEFNSNLRLWTRSSKTWPNRWYSNLIVLCFIILAYAASSLTFHHSGQGTNMSEVFSTKEDTFTISVVPLVVLGLCFLGLAAMSTWSLLATKIPSWSSSPMDTALAAMKAHNFQRQEARCMHSVHDREELAGPMAPRRRQRGALSAHPQVKWVFAGLWVLVGLCFAWAISICYMIKRTSPSLPIFGCASLLPNAQCSQYGIRPLNNHQWINSFAIVVVYALAQTPITFGLHCAELQSNLSRDESFWRTATSSKGCRLSRYDSIKAAFTSWQSVTLTLVKTFLHWVFGLCVTVSSSWIWFGPVQILYLAVFVTICALYITWLSVRRPKGPQPAAYGHLQTLLDLVDDWSEDGTIYWGHKGTIGGTQYLHAGTAPQELPKVEYGLYCGTGLAV